MHARTFQPLHALALSALLAAGASFPAAAQDAPAAPAAAMVPQAAVTLALQSELPPGTTVSGYDRWTVTQAAPAVALVEGTALLELGASAPVPVQFQATLDTPSQQVISFTYRLAADGTRAPEQDATLGRKVAARIAARLIEEFAEQPVQFALVELTAIRHTPRAIIMQGYGIADFAQEGTADVTFIATFDRESADLHALQYELATPATEADWSTTAQAGE